MTNIVPLSGDDNSGPFWLGAVAATSMQDAPHALYFWTGPDYLKTMKIPLLQGRFFTPADTTSTERVIVVDRELAQRYFPGVQPVGQTITVAHWGTARIIGVAGHVRHWGLNDPGTYNPAQIYISTGQIGDDLVQELFRSDLTIVVRSTLRGSDLLPAITHAVYGSGSSQPIYDVKEMEEIAAASIGPQRLSLRLLTIFAMLALLLACVGNYGMMSYSVAQREQEFGIRMALGASHFDVSRVVMRQSLTTVLIGLLTGLAATLLLGRILSSFSALLYGVKIFDPLTFTGVSLILTGASLLSSLIPAQRAARANPADALRAD
jgi:hypothetical protein